MDRWTKHQCGGIWPPKDLRRVGGKVISQKTSGHQRKRFSVIFKGLKKIPKEVQNRTGVVVAVAKGGSMTPALMQQMLGKTS